MFMPMTRPELSTSGPPEFPGLMAASVWNMLVRFSVEVPVESLAWTDRPLAEMIPWVTVGVPADSPSALPMATTASPTCTLSEFPYVTVGRLDCAGDLEQGDVVGGIGVDQRGRQGLEAAVERHRDGGGPGDDVVVGDDLAVGGDDHPRALVLLDRRTIRRRGDWAAWAGDLASMDTMAGQHLADHRLDVGGPVEQGRPGRDLLHRGPAAVVVVAATMASADHGADQGRGQRHHGPHHPGPVSPAVGTARTLGGGVLVV